MQDDPNAADDLDTFEKLRHGGVQGPSSSRAMNKGRMKRFLKGERRLAKKKRPRPGWSR